MLRQRRQIPPPEQPARFIALRPIFQRNHIGLLELDRQRLRQGQSLRPALRPAVLFAGTAQDRHFAGLQSNFIITPAIVQYSGQLPIAPDIGGNQEFGAVGQNPAHIVKFAAAERNVAARQSFRQRVAVPLFGIDDQSEIRAMMANVFRRYDHITRAAPVEPVAKRENPAAVTFTTPERPGRSDHRDGGGEAAHGGDFAPMRQIIIEFPQTRTQRTMEKFRRREKLGGTMKAMMHRMGHDEVDALHDLPCGDPPQILKGSRKIGRGEHLAHHPLAPEHERRRCGVPGP
ncbi:hypothetical protein SDC9_113227 [bioreactor metagenome]|uniref:Uncharacterized protein n=1 Tax=bioreactor metagenome TaxID=1076179 RepID=A0A645BLG8_9ZZZZ